METVFGRTLNTGIAFGNLVLYKNELQQLNRLNTGENAIVVANSLKPGMTMQFSKSNVVAFVVSVGTDTSHTAILARVMGLPALSDIQLNPCWDRKPAIVDGYTGTIIVEPDEATQLFYKSKQEEEENQRQLLQSYRDRPSVTKSGRKMLVYANVSSLDGIKTAISCGAEGIGVLKSEFLYLDSYDYPSEEELFQVYKAAALLSGERKLVIRTIDIGVDKTPENFELPREENPALGYRAIRICLDKPELFKTQLRAILRASAYGNVSILYPMIVSLEEVLRIQDILVEAMNELGLGGVPLKHRLKQGIMIETPASVLICKDLAKIVDFFSIGTNDLTQYMLAADRQNPSLIEIYNPYHPAILESIRYVAKIAHRAGIWTEISGELGGDTGLLPFFLNCGVDALAVAPGKILSVRRAICEIE